VLHFCSISRLAAVKRDENARDTGGAYWADDKPLANPKRRGVSSRASEERQVDELLPRALRSAIRGRHCALGNTR